MFIEINNQKCTGCGACVKACPNGAIALQDGLAVIARDRCTGCGRCIDACQFGAIREAAPANAGINRGGVNVFYGHGRGPGAGQGRGMGLSRGPGFRGASPAWSNVGRGRGGQPRPRSYGGYAAPRYPAPVREDGLGYLREQADVMKGQLDDIKRRIRDLEKEKKD